MFFLLYYNFIFIVFKNLFIIFIYLFFYLNGLNFFYIPLFIITVSFKFFDFSFFSSCCFLLFSTMILNFFDM